MYVVPVPIDFFQQYLASSNQITFQQPNNVKTEPVELSPRTPLSQNNNDLTQEHRSLTRQNSDGVGHRPIKRRKLYRYINEMKIIAVCDLTLDDIDNDISFTPVKDEIISDIADSNTMGGSSENKSIWSCIEMVI